jgi:AraC family transcriptional regulator of adaptative response / DNA-3-methyladenine glycosylase II
MPTSRASFPALHADMYSRAVDARDPRFDGVFFVGITTTRIYCRPICPARVSYPSRRRFFASAASAERAGFRPCLRCRPELAPGLSTVDSVPRLAAAVAHRIAAGALNGRGVADLARELGVSERHLRRAMERELGVSPVELAQTHRLLLAKRLLADTALSVTRIAYASGFQSLRRFNASFRERYRMAPSAVRRIQRSAVASHLLSAAGEEAPLRLTLAYRAPFAWDALLAALRADAIPGVELVDGRRYGRTVRVGAHVGVVFAEDSAVAPALGAGGSTDARARRPARSASAGSSHLRVEVSASLVPALMPLLARLRHLFDLDAEPAMIDTHLAQGGLGALVARRPGLRLPGTVDGFEVALRAIALGHASGIVDALGEPVAVGVAGLSRAVPDAGRVAEAGEARLTALGVPCHRVRALVAVARLVADGDLRLEPGSDVAAALRALAEVPGIGDRIAATIVMRALDWPDAFPASDRALWRAAGVVSAHELLRRAQRWRPWRAYAALHLRHHAADLAAGGHPTTTPLGHRRIVRQARTAARPPAHGAA